jgi:hypothetical protein
MTLKLSNALADFLQKQKLLNHQIGMDVISTRVEEMATEANHAITKLQDLLDIEPIDK